jgi:hypothetical protein
VNCNDGGKYVNWHGRTNLVQRTDENWSTIAVRGSQPLTRNVMCLSSIVVTVAKNLLFQHEIFISLILHKF